MRPGTLDTRTGTGTQDHYALHHLRVFRKAEVVVQEKDAEQGQEEVGSLTDKAIVPW